MGKVALVGSVTIHHVNFVLPFALAGLYASSDMVWVGPLLFASALSSGLAFCWSLLCQVVVAPLVLPMMLLPSDVTAPLMSGKRLAVLPATIVLPRFSVAPVLFSAIPPPLPPLAVLPEIVLLL